MGLLDRFLLVTSPLVGDEIHVKMLRFFFPSIFFHLVFFLPSLLMTTHFGHRNWSLVVGRLATANSGLHSTAELLHLVDAIYCAFVVPGVISFPLPTQYCNCIPRPRRMRSVATTVARLLAPLNDAASETRQCE